MQEIIAQGLTYFWGVWRFKWLALIVAWLVAVGGWVHVWQMPESYVATAKISVDTNTVLRPLLRGLAISPNIDQRVRLMSSTLFSRPNLEKLARMTDLDLNVTTDLDKERLISRLRRTISLTGQRGNSSVYNVRVVHRDRETARRITQAMITVFIESSLNDKRGDNVGARDFINDQIADYELRLIESENRLARFKQQNVDVLPSKWGGDYYTRLEAMRNESQQARMSLEEAQQRRDALKTQLTEGFSADSLVASGIMTPIDSRIQQMRLQLDNLTIRYTDQHPQVRQLRALMAELQAQREEELNAFLEGTAPAAATNSILGDMQSMLSQAEATVAELEARVASYARREEQLAAKVNQIPEVEAQLKQLDRDYGVIRKQYTELLERRESASISQSVEDNASDVTFRVIDPPFVPSRPTQPDKFSLNVTVLVLALAAGGGLAFLLSLLNPMVVDARILAAATGLPLLGVVTFNKDAKQRRRDVLGLAAFATVVLMLMGALGGVLFADELIGRVLAI